jgi:hypothetical protein
VIHNHPVRFLTRAVFTGRGREVAMDVVRGWADGRAHKSIACGLYGGPPRVSGRRSDPAR